MRFKNWYQKFKYASFTTLDVPEQQQDEMYDTFRQTYEESTGSSWDQEKFKRRSGNWVFYGDKDGYVAVRPQRSGMLKLTGMAGNPRSIIKGLNELIGEGKPVWGMVSQNIASMAEKKGFITPNPTLVKILIKLIPSNVLGGAEITSIGDDGGVNFMYQDVGAANKFFIANREYYSKLLENIDVMIANNIDKIYKVLEENPDMIKVLGIKIPFVGKITSWIIRKIPVGVISSAVKKVIASHIK
jgi:hypothetical protein